MGDTADAAPQAAPKLPLSLADFELLRRIGDGSYSHVVLGRHRGSGREYALKVVDKQYILRHKVVEYIRNERRLLDALAECAGVARLHFTFQDAFSLYLGLEHCPNGELYDQIRLKAPLDEPSARFYAAEVVLMLGELRRHAVVHRDLKPENLLLDAGGHLKLIDFGSAKKLAPEEAVPRPAQPPASAQPAAAAGDAAAAAGDGVRPAAAGEEAAAAGAAVGGEGRGAAADADGGSSSSSARGQQTAEAAAEQADGAAGSDEDAQAEGGGDGKRAVSLVGTADYVSPEILNNQPVTCAADLWALGCVLFQMFAGRPPFKTPSEYLTFQKIVAAEYQLPDSVPEQAADLIRRLLQLDPGARIGATDLGELRAHPFFAGVDWEHLRSQPAPEFVQELDPALSSASSSFDWELQSLASALPHISSEDRLPGGLD